MISEFTRGLEGGGGGGVGLGAGLVYLKFVKEGAGNDRYKPLQRN